MRIQVLHGPNLNLLGTREPDVYGSRDLGSIDRMLVDLARELSAAPGEVELVCRQSNHEGALIDWIHEDPAADGIVINPGGYTHTSVAIRDAIAATKIPTIEVHLSNVHAREPFRRRSMIAPVCVGTIAGLGASSYALGLRAIVEYVRARRNG